jgi:hypothetical protein
MFLLTALALGNESVGNAGLGAVRRENCSVRLPVCSCNLLLVARFVGGFCTSGEKLGSWVMAKKHPPGRVFLVAEDDFGEVPAFSGMTVRVLLAQEGVYRRGRSY